VASLTDAMARPERSAVAFAPPTDRDATAYGLVALAGEVEKVRTAVQGTRNHTLNTAAVKMGGLIAAGAIDEHTVYEALGAADGGLDYKATRDTLRSGLDYGMSQARAIPERISTWPESAAAGIAGPPSDDPFSAHYVDSAAIRSPPGPMMAAGPSPTAPNVASPTSDAPSKPSLADLVRERLPLIDWFTLWAADSAEEWIVEPLLPARRMIAIYSPPKVGKSLLLLEMAVAISRGTQVLGHTIDRPRRVLYVDFENDPEGDIRPRLVNMGVEPFDLENLCYLSYPSISKLDTEQGAAELVAAVQTYGCEVVVIDTVSRAIGGEENENDTWLKFYRHTGLEMKRLGVAVIRLDHTGKDETKGQRGGSAKSGDVDAVWRMARLTDGNDGQAETFRLVCEANRFPIEPGQKLLTFTRMESPLRHVVKATGSREAVVHACISYLDDNDDGRGYSAALLAEVRAGGVPGAAEKTLKEALSIRKAQRRAGVTDD
jgi:hypothetical protein